MSTPQPAAPERFASFFEAREWIKERTGKAYKGTDPELLVAAEKLGVLAAVGEILQRQDAIVRAAATEAAQQRAYRLQELADSTPPQEGPPLEFPPEWSSQKPGLDALPGFPISDIWEGYTPPTYLAKRLLAPQEVTVLFGQSGHFKSVLGMDLALCVATGRPFHGHKVNRAGVLYVAGEGHASVKKYARAWLIANGFNAASEQPAMYVTSAAANLLQQPGQLQATVEHASQALNLSVDLVVIDTLAANFGMGDENHASDMQLAISNARSAAPDAAILLVHHMGHGKEDRERGSYALIAAADIRLMAEYEQATQIVEMSWKKLKGDEIPEALNFRWRKVDLNWEDEDGEALNSVVLDLMDGEAQAPKEHPKMSKLGKHQETGIKTLRALYANARKNLKDRGDDPEKACILIEGWREILEKKGLKRQRWHDLLRDLQARNIIEIEGPHVYLVRSPNASALPSGSGQETGRENRPFLSVPVLLRNITGRKNKSEVEYNNVSDADTVPKDSTAALADPLAGLAPGGKGPASDAESKFYPPVPDDSDRLEAIEDQELDFEAATLGMARLPFESDDDLQHRINARRDLDRL